MVNGAGVKPAYIKKAAAAVWGFLLLKQLLLLPDSCTFLVLLNMAKGPRWLCGGFTSLSGEGWVAFKQV